MQGMSRTRWSGAQISRRAVLRAGGLAAAGLVGGTLAGCGGGQEEKPRPTGEATSTPRSGGVFRFSVSQLGELDPHTTADPFTTAVTHLTNNHIVRLSARTFVPEPDLAKSWEFPEATTALFHFNSGVRWQNRPPLNGRPFEAEDAVFSIERARTPKPEFIRRTNYEPVDLVQAPDTATLRIVTRMPYAPLLSVLGDQYELVVARELVEQYGDLKRPESMIGTGPYELGRYDRDIGFALTRRADDYFKADAAWLDGIEVSVIPDEQAAHAAFRSGRLDIGGVDELNLESAQRAHPDLNVYQTVVLTRELFMLNLNKEPFGDERVRLAVHRAIDRDQIVDTVWNGNGMATGPVAPVLTAWALPEDEFRSMPGYLRDKEEDIKEAKSLLAAAGLADGFDTTISTTESFSFGKVAQVIQVQLQKVGIKANIEVLDFGALVKRITDEDYRMLVISSPTGGPDPDQQMYAFYHTGGSVNHSGYGDPETDRLLDVQRSETDSERRKETVLELQRRLIEHPGGHLWLTCRGALGAAYPYVKNYVPSVGGIFAYYSLEEVWLDK